MSAPAERPEGRGALRTLGMVGAVALGEVAGLRNDLVDKVSGSLAEKVSGQLRLERIETTRVISSDIDELQHEVRRLAVARSSTPPALDGATFSPATVVESRVKNSAPL